jgi:hypothetical protein
LAARHHIEDSRGERRGFVNKAALLTAGSVVLARGQRDLAVYVQIRILFLRSGLFFWSLGAAVYDQNENRLGLRLAPCAALTGQRARVGGACQAVDEIGTDRVRIACSVWL